MHRLRSCLIFRCPDSLLITVFGDNAKSFVGGASAPMLFDQGCRKPPAIGAKSIGAEAPPTKTPRIFRHVAIIRTAPVARRSSRGSVLLLLRARRCAPVPASSPRDRR
ncbi:DUF6053 domain-containing protein [Lysobacter gummosus]|uniref:DUF6053 domain-containing protein n=1 Tax=Lysobacter gummosus TaxID=262324 RepID=UPI001C9DEB93